MGLVVYNVTWAESYLRIPSGILIHPAAWPQQTWGENWAGAVPLLGELGRHLIQYGQGQETG